jgi:hypothetical protein
MNVQTQLENAREVLERADTVDAWSRSAAFLGRQALEQAVREAIEARYGKVNRPSFSSQLVVLRTVVSPKVAKQVAWTWSALSSATHAHSYELPATGSELRRWIDTVARLADEIARHG